ncbi:hypothetical protein C8J56DRAFT_1130032 [Mycena floridula]|nr:hypothetical protein C8J56DRAFT_1130032 [Mycena floridula]
MKLESNPPVSANAADIGDFLPPKFIAIGTILVVVVVTFLGQYSSLTVSLGALGLLKSDIESAARDTLAASVRVPDIIIDVNQSRDDFELLTEFDLRLTGNAKINEDFLATLNREQAADKMTSPAQGYSSLDPRRGERDSRMVHALAAGSGSSADDCNGSIDRAPSAASDSGTGKTFKALEDFG